MIEYRHKSDDSVCEGGRVTGVPPTCVTHGFLVRVHTSRESPLMREVYGTPLPTDDPQFLLGESVVVKHASGGSVATPATLAETREVEHVYTSTACQHGLHDRCRKECKFCSTWCVCTCHDRRTTPGT